MATNRRFLAIGIMLGLGAGAIAGAGVVAAKGPAPAPTPASVTRSGAVGTTVGAASGTAATGTAIAYPYPFVGGIPGIAPDHTIVVTGTGSGDPGTDGSERAAAEKTALTAALADAKDQATIIAATIGVSLKGIVSVSASVGSFGAIPYMGGAVGGGPTTPVPAPNMPVPVWAPQLTVSVTVVYSID